MVDVENVLFDGIEIVGLPYMVEDEWCMVSAWQPSSMLNAIVDFRGDKPTTAEFYLVVNESQVDLFIRRLRRAND